MNEAVPFSEALKFWARLGLISFGGPAGQIAIMQKTLVDERQWISQEDFLHALSFCMLLPGPEAQQLATYIGWKMHGYRGGVAAGVLFVLPGAILLLVLSYLYVTFGRLATVSAVLDGFKAVVVAIVFDALFRLGPRTLTTWPIRLIAVFAFLSIFALGVPFPVIVAGAALAGIAFVTAPRLESLATSKPFDVRATLRLGVLFSVFWAIPFAAITLLQGFGSRLSDIYLFFTKAAFVTFGGAYAVLAYVNQAIVAASWITPAQAIDGFALAETTPGPLILVLQFYGYAAGWNAGDGSNSLGIAAAILTTYVTFLPSFFFIFAGAPYVDGLRTNRPIRAALSGVSAAVVGVILNLAFVFSIAVIFPGGMLDWFAVFVALAAFAALRSDRAHVIAVIAGGGAAGLAKALWFG